MVVREDHTLGGEGVDVWCADFATQDAEIRVAEIVRENDEKVGRSSTSAPAGVQASALVSATIHIHFDFIVPLLAIERTPRKHCLVGLPYSHPAAR